MVKKKTRPVVISQNLHIVYLGKRIYDIFLPEDECYDILEVPTGLTMKLKGSFCLISVHGPASAIGLSTDYRCRG